MNHLEMLDQLVALVERSALSEIELRHPDGWRIRLTRAAHTDAARRVAPPAPPIRRPQSADAEDLAAPSNEVVADVTSRALLTIKAGIAGTFCARPAPDAPPFVSVGDIVEEGQTVAIVEAMKMLNAVEAEHRGRIVRIVAQDQSTVEAATPLFEMEPLEENHV